MVVDPNATGFKVFPYNRMCDMCANGAIIKMRGGHVCYQHYMELHQADADRYCAEHGLDTTEKKIEHCRRLARSFVARQKSVSNPQREPGSDDE